MKDINELREEFLNDKFKKYDQGKEKFTMIPQLALKELPDMGGKNILFLQAFLQFLKDKGWLNKE